MAFMRSVFYWHNESSTRYDTYKGKRIPRKYVGPTHVGAVLTDGSTVIVGVQDQDWYTKSSAVPAADIVGEIIKGSDGKWSGQFTGPHGNTLMATDDCGRREWSHPEQAAAAVLACRNAAYSEEVRILANPVEHLERELKCHDWYCHYSDAPGVCMAGENHMKRIRKLMDEVPVETARELWAKHAPKDHACPV